MCGWKISAKNKNKLGLKTHIRRKRHRWNRHRANLTEKRDIKLTKLEAQQNKLPKVRWGDDEVDNCLQFPYLDSIFQTDDDIISDIR